ncbi:MAG TPA: hypothetical protein PLI95_16825, partial [Polyangiaceae bacterium]|nr:hypothetical protein [Polyangiaceae bacterium]
APIIQKEIVYRLLVGEQGSLVVGGAGEDHALESGGEVYGAVYGRSLPAGTLLRATPESQYPKPNGIRVRRVGGAADETVLDVPNTHSINYEPLWVEELSPGKIALLYTRKEVVYLEDGQETILADGLPELGSDGYTFSQIHRVGSTLWFGGQPEGGTPLLVRWDPKSGQKPQVVSSPVPSSEWIGLHGFLGARSQVTTANPLAETLDIPLAYTAQGFDGSAIKIAPVALTPCTNRAACRMIGESYLLGVVGMETTSPRALYGVWAWLAPGGGVQNGPTDYVGYYLSPLRAPEEAAPDAGVPDSEPPEAAVEASVEGGAEAEAGPTGPETIASGLNVPGVIRAQGDYLFFTESTDQQNIARINRMAKAGGAVESWVADAGWPTMLLSDEQALYYPTQRFGSPAVIESVPLSGGSTVQIAAEGAHAMAIRDGYLYWTPDMQAVRRINLATKTIEPLGTSTWPCQSIAVDATYVYLGQQDQYAGMEQIFRIALPGGTVEQLPDTSVNDPKFLLPTDTSLFIRTYGMIGVVPKQGGAYTKLADLQGDNVKLIERGDRIIATDGSHLVSVGATPEDKQTIDSSMVSDFDADATHAYWTEAQNPGRIRRVKLSEN